MYDDKLMTVSDLAEYCQLTEHSIYQLVSSKRFNDFGLAEPFVSRWKNMLNLI